MNKYKAIIAIMLILGTVAAQPMPAPSIGGGIDELYKALADNTAKIDDSVKKIDSIPGQIQESISTMSGNILMGLACFIAVVELLKMFFNKVAKIRKRKTYEEHIIQLEIQNQKQMKLHNEMLEKLNKNLEFAALTAEYLNNGQTQINEKDIDVKAFINGLCFGVLLVILIHVGGVL